MENFDNDIIDDGDCEKEICSVCHGCGEQQTASRWIPCSYCKGTGEKQITDMIE